MACTGMPYWLEGTKETKCCKKHDKDYEDANPKLLSDITLCWCIASNGRWYSVPLSIIVLFFTTTVGWWFWLKARRKDK